MPKRISDQVSARFLEMLALGYLDKAIAQPMLDDSDIVNIANETHIAMPDDCDDQAEMLAIVHAVLSAHGITKREQ